MESNVKEVAETTVSDSAPLEVKNDAQIPEETPEDPKNVGNVEEKVENQEEIKLPDEPFKDITRIKLESAISDEIYVQMKRRFQKFLRSELKNEIKEENNGTEIFYLFKRYIEGVTTAVIVQMLLHNLSLVLQGLLAGLACGHCVFAFVFATPEILLRGYQHMAIIVQSTFYLCFAVSTVNAFDRFEAGTSTEETIKKFLSLQRGGFNVIIWIAGTIASILMAQYDEYLSKSDLELLINNRTLIIWRYLSLIRAVCALVGWLFVALQPNTNCTRDQLLELVGS
uniref:Uncharacterized protein n=1 Tax=Panagrolaimus sp. JU765 TaxID=591449 RepID=A0AC34RQ28_9BILA